MKYAVIVKVLYLAAILVDSSAFAQDYRELPITLSNVYVPSGYDDNDEVVIVIDGEILGHEILQEITLIKCLNYLF